MLISPVGNAADPAQSPVYNSLCYHPSAAGPQFGTEARRKPLAWEACVQQRENVTGSVGLSSNGHVPGNGELLATGSLLMVRMVASVLCNILLNLSPAKFVESCQRA